MMQPCDFSLRNKSLMPSTFKTPAEVYSTYTALYEELSTFDWGFHSTTRVSYEDMVLSPLDVIAVLGKKLGWGEQKNSSVQDFKSAAKHHGNALGHSDAFE